MHFPGRRGFQFFAMGTQAKIERRRKVKPQNAQREIRDQVRRRERRYRGVRVEEAVSAKRRRYWKRIESLMKVAQKQYEAFEA
jgi:hypothetical protein